MNREFLLSDPARYAVNGLDDVATPRILFYEWALVENRDRCFAACDGVEHLRLMVKTFKSSRLLQYYTDAGLTMLKASSVREARAMVAGTSVGDVLVAFPLFGPAIDEFAELRRDYPDEVFSVLVNNIHSARALSGRIDRTVRVYIDVDPGMRRTGAAFGEPLSALAKEMAGLPSIEIRGLHVYDGHVHHPNRHAVSDYSRLLMRRIDESVRGLSGTCRIEEVVTSSSLTMKSNSAAYVEGGYSWKHTVSPGTSVLWDSNYNDIMPGEYEYACVVATRIIDALPTGDSHIITTDCGIKLGASVDCGPAHVLSFDGYRFCAGYERHGSFCWLGMDRATGRPLTTDLSDAVGKVVLVIPKHVCTTVNHYDDGYLIRDGAIQDRIVIDARDG